MKKPTIFIVVILITLGLLYVGFSLYMLQLYVNGLHDISLTLCVRIPLAIGVLLLITVLILVKGYKIAFVVGLFSSLFTFLWFVYIIYKLASLGALTNVLCILIIIFTIIHLAILIKLYHLQKSISLSGNY